MPQHKHTHMLEHRRTTHWIMFMALAVLSAAINIFMTFLFLKSISQRRQEAAAKYIHFDLQFTFRDHFSRFHASG